MTSEAMIIGLAAVVVLGVVAQWVGRRLQFAPLLLLLPAGLLAGSFGIVTPEQLFGDTLFPMASMLVALLLFQSGLNLRLQAPAGAARQPVVRLITIGALITFAGSVAAALVVVGLDRNLAFLLGAILIVSGPTVVGPLLDVLNVREPTATVLRWEGVTLDPIGATVGVVVLNIVLAAGRGGMHPALQLAARVAVGGAIGLLAAGVLIFVLSRFLVTDDMEAAAALAVVVAAYAIAEVLLSEAGLFAALALGVAAANQRLVPTDRIVGFGETLEVLIIGVLFIMLGALIDVDDLAAVAGRASVMVVVLVLVVRPLAAATALAGTGLAARDRALIGWMCPRGIVAAATAAQFSGELDTAGFDAGAVPPVTFAVILGTGVIYSLTSPLVGRALRVSEPPPAGIALLGDADWLGDLARALRGLGASVLLLTARTPDRDDVPGVRVVPVHESDIELRRLLDEEKVGQALAATEATVSTMLVVADLVEALGRRHVYLLPEHDVPSAPERRRERWSPQPFATGVTSAAIAARTRDGATVEVVRGALPPDALRLAVVHDDGRVDLGPDTRWADRRNRADGAAVVALVDRAATFDRND